MTDLAVGQNGLLNQEDPILLNQNNDHLQHKIHFQ